MRRTIFILVLLLLSACSEQAGPSLPNNSEAVAAFSPQTQGAWWQPQPGLTWQWQLTGVVDTEIRADVYDIDLDEDKTVVAQLHSQGVKVVCYISVGSFEDWREDADQFPDEILGKRYAGWSGERWLDIRRIDLLAPIMRARLDTCAEKGFDGVEPDNIEIYTNDTGFPLTYADQLRYAEWLAAEAHARGLAIGLKNAPEQVGDLVDLFDFAITEDCFYYQWCQEMQPFIEAGKAVFAAEYTDQDGNQSSYCRQAQRLRFSLIIKDRELDSWIQTCP